MAAQAPGATDDTTALQRLLVAEDARGTGPDGLDPLQNGLKNTDTLLRRLAVRGLGRFQRPALGRLLLPMLADSVPALRAEAANAIAQSLRRVRRGTATPDSAQLSVSEAAAALSRALAAESDALVVDVLGQSLGRLAHPDSAAARAAEGAIRARLSAGATPGLIHGMYTLARVRRATGNLTDESVILLRAAAIGAADTVVRRLALLTLAAAGGLDSLTAERAARDRDDEARRMMLRGAGALSPKLRASFVRRALADPSATVRIEALAAARLGDGLPDCTPILAATRDRDLYVALTAIDSLGSGCADRSTTAAAGLLPRVAGAERWGVRLYAARTAAVVGARAVLLRLAADADRNVQEAAIAGLAATGGHEADSVYLRALRSSGNQVALAAADALKGTTDPGALPALLDAFDRLSARHSENTKDPRVSMLERIGELGDRSSAPRLTPYLADFDTTIAAMTAATLTKWTGDSVGARPAPLPIRAEPLADVFLLRDVRLRVTMAPSSGSGSFTVLLSPGEAPASVARVLRLARERFYDGKVFQRVEPNFVIQGGGPDASEYVGDATFMRDELTWRTHARGTLGISSRGRDTGDGQWFINLVDNPLLDHEFTIFGRIDSGQRGAERILEGDRIARIELLQGR